MAYIGNSPGVASQRVVTTFTATAGQTTFTPSSGYTLGYCDVFFNGVKLVNGDDYTASNGTSVVLASAAAAGDSVEIVAHFPRGLSDGYTKTEADGRYAQRSNNLSDLSSASAARTNLGLGNVENKSSATIRGELTSGNVTGALGYTPVNKAGDTMTGLLEMRKSGSANDTGVAATLRKADGTGGLRVYPSLGGGQMNGRVVEGDCGVISGEQFGGVTIGSHDGASIRISQSALQLNGRNSAAQADLGIDSAGRVTTPYQPSFLARPPANYAVNSDTIIGGTWSVEFNTGGHFNASNGTFTAPVGGIYALSWNVFVSAANSRRDAFISVNGSIRLRTEIAGYDASTTRNINTLVSATLQLAAGDSVTFGAMTTSGNIYVATTPWSYASGHLIG